MVFYVNKSLVDAETRYSYIEKLALALVMVARKLWRKFQFHTIVVMTTQPLNYFLHNLNHSNTDEVGYPAKWVKYWISDNDMCQIPSFSRLIGRTP